MTAGLAACAVGVGSYASVLGERFGPMVEAAARWNTLGTIGIAATPLDSANGGPPHVVAAGLTYASLAALPLLAAPTFRSDGRRALAGLSVAAGVASGACLAASASGRSARSGLLQRIGLTVGHAWIMGSALGRGRGHGLGSRGPVSSRRLARPPTTPR
jgi:hypothetical protein